MVENPQNLPRELNAWVQATVRWIHNPPLEQERNAPPVIVGETSLSLWLLVKGVNVRKWNELMGSATKNEGHLPLKPWWQVSNAGSRN